MFVLRLTRASSLSQDKKTVESVCLAFSRLVDTFKTDAAKVKEIARHGLLANVQRLVSPCCGTYRVTASRSVSVTSSGWHGTVDVSYWGGIIPGDVSNVTGVDDIGPFYVAALRKYGSFIT